MLHKTWARLAALAVCAAILPIASAQTFFSEDFEGTTLQTNETPAGKWTELQNPVGGDTLALNAMSAHRGAKGLRLHDGNQYGSAYQLDSNLLHQSTVAGSTFYLRSWIRVIASNKLGTIFLAEVGTHGTPAAVIVLNVHRAMAVAGWNSTLNYQEVAGVTLDDASWHLVELGLTGVGTTAGERLLWVDGALVASTLMVDWSTGIAISEHRVGEPLGLQDWVGDVDFDDVRFSLDPPASTLKTTVEAVARVNECVPVTVTLVDSATGAQRMPPYTFTATVSAAAGAFFQDNTCKTAATTFSMTALAGHFVAYWKPSAVGTDLEMKATHVDFLSVSAKVEVTDKPFPPPDGGSASDDGGDPNQEGQLTLTCPDDVLIQTDHGEGAITSYPPARPGSGTGEVAVTYSQAAGTLFPQGRTAVTATATDEAGATRSCTFVVTVNGPDGSGAGDGTKKGCSAGVGAGEVTILSALLAAVALRGKRRSRG